MAQDDQVQAQSADQPSPAAASDASAPGADAAPAGTELPPSPADAAPLSANERAELAELRAWRTSQQAEPEPTATPADVGQPPTATSAVADAGPEESDLPYGTHKCPECSATVAVQYPGYADPFARAREAICENLHRFFPSSKTRVRAR